ncbi:putative quorum-sensing-regulated virulence factor [Rickettsiella endosymbiont of Dermanyssus gallinae]|uniref:putative quorum-sensing-regulated virulence factor n=1 Tax=Rickettsiella endosymbiont of Dermanyssus gallinae TaxID=2856608 RepID=UPI001C52F743|nr:DUF3820 family protein [Rickettsiella endosymbiont of Dermanyssus gallinae]
MLPTIQTNNLLLSVAEMDQVMKLADRFSKSNCVPKEYQNNPANTFIAILMGLEVGLKPAQAVQGIAVINGRPCIWGDTLIGLVQASGQLEYIKETIEGDIKTNAIATCIIKRKGMPNEIIRTFSVQDAERAGLLKKSGTWQLYPQRMLQVRPRSWGLRDTFADILRGLYIREEVEDYPVEKDITPINKSQILVEKLQQQLNKEVQPTILENSTIEQEAVIEAINQSEWPNESPPIDDSEQEKIKEELPVMPIGKYKGNRLDEIPENYLKWLAANSQEYKPLAEQELARRKTH